MNAASANHVDNYYNPFLTRMYGTCEIQMDNYPVSDVWGTQSNQCLTNMNRVGNLESQKKLNKESWNQISQLERNGLSQNFDNTQPINQFENQYANSGQPPQVPEPYSNYYIYLAGRTLNLVPNMFNVSILFRPKCTTSKK